MSKVKNHLINQFASLTEAVNKLEKLKSNAVLFVVDESQKLIGSITDGDIRRALLSGKSMDTPVLHCVEKNPAFIEKENINVEKIISWRNRQFKVIPIVDRQQIILDVLNFNEQKSILPLDCVIMAGGKGERLKPLTDNTPKPLLPVGDKPIIEYGINNYSQFGIELIYVTTNYLHEQLESFISKKKSEKYRIKSVKESEFMGTIGALKLIKDFNKGAILVSNSDLLTNVDLEQFYLNFIKSNSDCCVLSVPYHIDIPFGVLQVKDELLNKIDEKPTYTFNTNGGMYIFKKELLDLIPEKTSFSAVDFLELLMKNKKKTTLYQHHGYWLDIGNHNDYQRAQKDILTVFSSSKL